MAQAEATELFNYLNNTGNLWCQVENWFRVHELRRKRKEYVPTDLECNLRMLIDIAARRYSKEYSTGRDANELFTFTDKVAVAHMVRVNFENELECGNSWLG